MRSRSSNLELLRIICIAMIISFHYVYKGNFSEWGCNLTNKILVDIVYYFGEIAVNCFILISGYFFEETNFKWKKVCLIILQCCFYILFALIILDVFGFVDNWSIRTMLFPIMRNKYWFVTVYVFIYILTPYLKRLVKIITEQEMRMLIIIQLFIWSFYPTIMLWLTNSTSPEAMPYYNRFIWLMLVYIIGAYIKMYNPAILSSLKNSAVLFAITACCTLGYILLCEWDVLPISRLATFFWTPNSIVELLLSLSLFGMFQNINIHENRVVNYVASCVLGIYMLHDGELVDFWWSHVFKNNTYQYDRTLWVQIVYATLVIIVFGIIVESIRKILERYVSKLLFDKSVVK